MKMTVVDSCDDTSPYHISKYLFFSFMHIFGVFVFLKEYYSQDISQRNLLEKL